MLLLLCCVSHAALCTFHLSIIGMCWYFIWRCIPIKKHHQIGVKMHSHKIGAKRLILIVVSFISTRKVDGVKWSTIYDTPKDKKADKRLDGGEEAIKIYLLFSLIPIFYVAKSRYINYSSSILILYCYFVGY